MPRPPDVRGEPTLLDANEHGAVDELPVGPPGVPTLEVLHDLVRDERKVAPIAPHEAVARHDGRVRRLYLGASARRQDALLRLPVLHAHCLTAHVEHAQPIRPQRHEDNVRLVRRCGQAPRHLRLENPLGVPRNLKLREVVVLDHRAQRHAATRK